MKNTHAFSKTVSWLVFIKENDLFARKTDSINYDRHKAVFKKSTIIIWSFNP